jgi:hydroxysqualene dehydroxylase
MRPPASSPRAAGPGPTSGRCCGPRLRDSLFGAGHGGWGGSNLLLPRQDLGALFPHAAQAWLQARGTAVRLGQRVQAIARTGTQWQVDGEAFDQVVLACPVGEAARLVAGAGLDAAGWVQCAGAMTHEAIATVYTTGGPRLPLPMLALRQGPDAPAQFVFDRGQLGGPAGLLAFVASASNGDRESLEAQVLGQARALGWNVQPLQTVVEKRATFACVPDLQRPPIAIVPGLWACGDYVEGPYPATLEGAVRSALEVIRYADIA